MYNKLKLIKNFVNILYLERALCIKNKMLAYAVCVWYNQSIYANNL